MAKSSASKSVESLIYEQALKELEGIVAALENEKRQPHNNLLNFDWCWNMVRLGRCSRNPDFDSSVYSVFIASCWDRMALGEKKKKEVKLGHEPISIPVQPCVWERHNPAQTP